MCLCIFITYWSLSAKRVGRSLSKERHFPNLIFASISSFVSISLNLWIETKLTEWNLIFPFYVFSHSLEELEMGDECFKSRQQKAEGRSREWTRWLRRPPSLKPERDLAPAVKDSLGILSSESWTKSNHLEKAQPASPKETSRKWVWIWWL